MKEDLIRIRNKISKLIIFNQNVKKTLIWF